MTECTIERWFFYQDAAGNWKWARLDMLGTVLGHSDATFETRAACVQHARQRGYDERARTEPLLNERLGPSRSASASA